MPKEELEYKEGSALSNKAWSLRLKASRRWVCRGDDFSVDDVAVSPCYRGHGLEARLLRMGLDIADEREARVFTLAQTVGELSLFSEHGFKVVEEVEMYYGKYGRGKESYLIREPEWETICDDSEE